jgi:hypothetical protein
MGAALLHAYPTNWPCILSRLDLDYYRFFPVNLFQVCFLVDKGLEFLDLIQ